MKLVKPFTPHFIAWSVKKVFDRSICREQNTSLQCLASGMPEFVMPSAARNGKVYKEKKHKNLAVLAKTPRPKLFFSSKTFKQQRKKTVPLTRAPENVGQCFSTGVPQNM